MSRNSKYATGAVFKRGSKAGAHPLYSTWKQVRRRCYDEMHQEFERQGAKGIRVCERWLDTPDHDGFAAFCMDMGDRPEGMLFCRRDNSADYSPVNCHWATPAEQRLNRPKSYTKKEY